MSKTEPITLPVDLDESVPVEETTRILIETAANMRASDVFLGTDERAVKAACRHMGMYRPLRPFTLDYGRRLIAYLKAMADIDHSERIHPTEGRWVLHREGRPAVDMRVNCIPTVFGDDLALRLLDREFALMDLEKFNFSRDEHMALLGLLQNGSGLLLVTGPTGSGKTTLMYSCLDHLRDGSRKINTLEDPVEFVLDGVRQSQVNTRMGVDFSHLLTACLRQAPDVIMIGEIRDAKTAQIAVQAANAGHLVLATMHAPLAISAVSQMLAFGVNRHFLMAALIGVVSQRLLRRLCEECRIGVDLSAASNLLGDLREHLPEDWEPRIYTPSGCESCHQTGYNGRLCVTEILPFNDELRTAFVDDVSREEIETLALDHGMIGFRHSTMLKVAMGETTIEEVFRVIPMEHLAPRS